MRASSSHRHRFRSASLCCHETIEQNYIRRGCIVPSYEGTSAFHTCIRIFSVKCFAELVIARMRARYRTSRRKEAQGSLGLARLEFSRDRAIKETVTERKRDFTCNFRREYNLTIGPTILEMPLGFVRKRPIQQGRNIRC